MKKRIVALILSFVLLGSVPVLAASPFDDVNESDYFYTSVLFTEGKILHGMGNKLFKPYDNLTIAEAIKISACIHAKHYDVSITPCAESEHWADGYYDYAVLNGIIKESDFDRADFDNAITRDRLFYIFANTLPDSEYIEINDVEHAPEKIMPDYIKKLFCAGIVVGNENGFERDKNIIRADVSIVITRMMAYSRRQLAFVPELYQYEN